MHEWFVEQDVRGFCLTATGDHGGLAVNGPGRFLLPQRCNTSATGVFVVEVLSDEFLCKSRL